jgi:hypothetical protein
MAGMNWGDERNLNPRARAALKAARSMKSALKHGTPRVHIPFMRVNPKTFNDEIYVVTLGSEVENLTEHQLAQRLLQEMRP